MALFGRRKPGFAKEEIIKSSEIPGEFSDALDPAMQKEDQNPKYEEKTVAQEAARKALEGTPAALGETKQDLFEYMESLPEVNDPFPPMPEEPEVEEVPPTPTQVLAGYITTRTESAQLTPKALLLQEIEDAENLLAAMAQDESCRNIAVIQGKKDVYYYDRDLMTANYARIAMLIADDDTLRTMAEMVRWNCKTYPSPTPISYFTRHPYYMEKAVLKDAVAQFEGHEEYGDIKMFISGKGEEYLYSDKVMSARYAKSLADFAEDEENS